MFMVLDLTSSLRAKFLPDMTAGHLQMSVRIARVLAQVCMLKPEAIDDNQYNQSTTRSTTSAQKQWPVTRSRTFLLVCTLRPTLDSHDQQSPVRTYIQLTPPPPTTTFNPLSHSVRAVSDMLLVTPSTSGRPPVVGTRNPRTGRPTLPSWASQSSSSLVSSSA